MVEPKGDAELLTEVDLMVIPALAVDLRGNRLGRGKGYYDRALGSITAKSVVALVHDNELVDSVPTETHDAQVTAICTCSTVVSI